MSIRVTSESRVRVVLVVPVVNLALHWHKLLTASVLSQASGFPDGIARVRRPSLAFGTLTATPRPNWLSLRVTLVSSPRAMACLRRSPAPEDSRAGPDAACGSMEDMADRLRLREALLAATDGPRRGTPHLV